MLKTLDILIGATTVLLVFSMAVTVLTQAFTTAFNRRGSQLRDGLADLLQQLGLSERGIAEQVAHAVLTHPMLSGGKGWGGKIKLGTVIHREEFTKALMDAASGDNPDIWKSLTALPSGKSASNQDASQTPPASAADLKNPGAPTVTPPAATKPAQSESPNAQTLLLDMLKANGISDPQATLKNVRTMAMQLEREHPELAADVRQTHALLREAESDYVAKVNSWFDQTIDRVGQRFTKHAHYVTVGLATLVVLTVQLDMIAVVDRLSFDDTFRNQIVASTIANFAQQGNSKNQEKPTSTDKKQDQTSNPQNVSNSSPGTTSKTTSAPAPPASPGVSKDTTNAAHTPTEPPAVKNSTESAQKGANAGVENDAASNPSFDSQNPPSPGTIPKFDQSKYYDILSNAGLVTMPMDAGWFHNFTLRKIPGMLIAILLISLGAPFWYNILKNLLGLRSVLAQKDDMQRMIRQTTQDTPPGVAGATSSSAALPASLRGERGDLEAVG